MEVSRMNPYELHLMWISPDFSLETLYRVLVPLGEAIRKSAQVIDKAVKTHNMRMKGTFVQKLHNYRHFN